MCEKIKYKFTPNERRFIKCIKEYFYKRKCISTREYSTENGGFYEHAEILAKDIAGDLNISESLVEHRLDKLAGLYFLKKDGDKIILTGDKPDRILPLEFDGNLKYLNGDSYYSDSFSSTNEIFKQLNSTGNLQSGDIIVTEHQDNGRGQFDRGWFDLKFKSVLLSCFIRPVISLDKFLLLSSIVGLALSETIENACSVKTEIKWPNDIFINGKKCAGILIEGSIMESKVEYCIIGIGLNVNYSKDEFPPYLRDIATSLKIETCKINNRLEIFNRLIENLDKCLHILIFDQSASTLDKVNKKLHHRGGRVTFNEKNYFIEELNLRGKLVLTNLSGGKVELSTSGGLSYDYGY